MKKFIQFVLLFGMTFSLVACGSKDDSEKEEKTSEKTTEKKETKKEDTTKKDTKKEDKEKEPWKKYQKKTSEESEEESYYEEEQQEEVQEEVQDQPQEETQDSANYVYVPEEDMVFSSYDEALSYGGDHLNDMYQKYGKAVQYYVTKNDSGEIVLCWSVKE